MMATEALIHVDLLNDFFEDGALPVQGASRIKGNVRRINEHFVRSGRPVVHTRERHPEETVHFGKWPRHGVAGTYGAQVPRDLDLRGTKDFYKGQSPDDDGYSGFEGTSTEGEGLETYLRRNNVTRVFIEGLATDYCVKNTALDAVRLKFETYVITDAIEAVNLSPDDGEKALAEMEQAGVKFVTTEEVVKNRVGLLS